MIDKNNQLTLLTKQPEDDYGHDIICHRPPSKAFKVFIDGASRKNPGLSGAGFLLQYGDDIILQHGFFLGEKTNNQAEYIALLISAFFIQQYVKKTDSIILYSDSELLIRQMNGIYKVRDHTLKKMQMLVFEWLQGYSIKLCHVYREQNQKADELANYGIDKKVCLPKKLHDLLVMHDIL